MNAGGPRPLPIDIGVVNPLRRRSLICRNHRASLLSQGLCGATTAVLGATRVQ